MTIRNYKRAVTEEQKEEVLAELLTLWKNNPQLRLGQLLLNLGFDFYYVEDYDLIAELEKFYKGIKNEKNV